jgi:hypothetical protein
MVLKCQPFQKNIFPSNSSKSVISKVFSPMLEIKVCSLRMETKETDLEKHVPPFVKAFSDKDLKVAFRDPGFGIRVSGSGFRVSGGVFRVSGFGL